MQNKNFPFLLLTLSLLIVLVLPSLIQDGMFMDGLLYATVAKNMSEGIGSFWAPHLSATIHPFFDQQPPLGLGMQALFFDLFGTSMYVERFYSFLMLCLGAFLITQIWKTIFRGNMEIIKMYWVPVLLWIIIPVSNWAYANNLLECTMAVFDLAAVLFILKFIRSSDHFHLVLAGLFLFLASLTKGFQGLFPAAGLFLYWIVFRSIPFFKMVSRSLVLAAVPAILYFLLLYNKEAQHNLLAYLHGRVANSLMSVSTVDNRFYIIGRLFLELLPPVLLTGIIILLPGKKHKPVSKIESVKYFYFLSLIGVSASFPLMVTLEQRGFYITTSLPFYALGLGALAAPYLSGWIQNLEAKIISSLKIPGFVLLSGALIFSFLQAGKTKRDADMLHDVHLIGSVVPKGTVLGSTRELWGEWALQEYLVRHYYICQDDEIIDGEEFLLLESEAQIPDNIKAEKVNIPTIKYHLYKVKE